VTVELQSLPQTGRLEIDIRVSSDINVSAYAARQKVDNFVLNEISYLMHAGEPTLVVSDAIYWRVPVILSIVSRGDVGEVGTISVDAQTGQLIAAPQLIAEVTARAEGLAARFTSEADE
jgi:hypothetical protein